MVEGLVLVADLVFGGGCGVGAWRGVVKLLGVGCDVGGLSRALVSDWIFEGLFNEGAFRQLGVRSIGSDGGGADAEGQASRSKQWQVGAQSFLHGNVLSRDRRSLSVCLATPLGGRGERCAVELTPIIIGLILLTNNGEMNLIRLYRPV